MVRAIYQQLPVITATGTAVVMVEQNTSLALQQARYVYCLREGRIVLQGSPEKLTREAVSEAYFGTHHHA